MFATEPGGRAQHVLRPVHPSTVELLPGVFSTRWELNRRYLMELTDDHLLQNHYFEAGIWGPPSRTDDMHGGWETPHSLVRGQFLGHWLSAAAHVIEARGDGRLRGKADWIVSELARCQTENGGEWVASVPPRDLDRLVRGRPTWATQYVIEKTLTGLLEMHRYAGNEQALEVVVNAARGLHRWAGSLSREAMDDILDWETGRMLELWVDLYAVTGAREHLDLVERYTRARLFDRLRAGEDVLTNRHANTTIPEITGAARAWEVLGGREWRDTVDAYWRLAVTDRGFFATGGQTSGEVWTPPFRLAGRLSDRNQEHCTVYNMMRLAEMLLRWTGDASYADYRERNMHGGILAQQHPQSGMVCYFLPMRAGACKEWGTRTDSFFCCHGTLVQAHSLHGTQVYYEDDAGLVVAQLMPSRVRWEHQGVPVTVTLSEVTGSGSRDGRVDLGSDVGSDRPGELVLAFDVECARPLEFTLSIHLPYWLTGPVTLQLGDDVQRVQAASTFHPVRRRWSHERLVVRLPRGLRAEALPDRPSTIAFLEGPTVLAGLCDEERELVGDAARPETMLVPQGDREWDAWLANHHTVGQPSGIRFIPLQDVTDERYSIYFPVRTGARASGPAP